jgi:hypothetical protein
MSRDKTPPLDIADLPSFSGRWADMVDESPEPPPQNPWFQKKSESDEGSWIRDKQSNDDESWTVVKNKRQQQQHQKPRRHRRYQKKKNLTGSRNSGD